MPADYIPENHNPQDNFSTLADEAKGLAQDLDVYRVRLGRWAQEDPTWKVAADTFAGFHQRALRLAEIAKGNNQ